MRLELRGRGRGLRDHKGYDFIILDSDMWTGGSALFAQRPVSWGLIFSVEASWIELA